MAFQLEFRDPLPAALTLAAALTLVGLVLWCALACMLFCVHMHAQQAGMH